MNEYIKPRKNTHISLMEAYLKIIRKKHDILVKKRLYKEVVQMYLDLEYERNKLHYRSILPLEVTYSPELRVGYHHKKHWEYLTGRNL